MTLIESLLLITNLLIIFLCYLNHIGIKLMMKIIEAKHHHDIEKTRIIKEAEDWDRMMNPKNQQLPRKPPKEF